MNTESLKEVIKTELPGLLRDDPALREFILELTRHQYADRVETESRFDRVLAELQRDREEQNRKWDENNAQMREEFKRTHEEIMAIATKQEQNMGALGARWGMQTEQAFRDGLAAIVEKSFGVQVHTINEFDDQGIVFGRPDQVELDVIVKNGVLILCEIKSSMSKSDMYVFGRKAEYYERVHQRTPDRLIVISPWIDGRAKKVAEALGIETYGYSTELKVL
ncbi:MAG: DUF3782 domain-containing protein [Candidatus Competibacteraceae bacterium]